MPTSLPVTFVSDAVGFVTAEAASGFGLGTDLGFADLPSGLIPDFGTGFSAGVAVDAPLGVAGVAAGASGATGATDRGLAGGALIAGPET